MNTSGTATTIAAADDRNPSMAVIDLLAHVENTDPLALDPLYSAIDPDALDALCQSGPGLDSIEFTYSGHDVTIATVVDELEITIEPGPAPVEEPSGRGTADHESSL